MRLPAYWYTLAGQRAPELCRDRLISRGKCVIYYGLIVFDDTGNSSRNGPNIVSSPDVDNEMRIA